MHVSLLLGVCVSLDLFASFSLRTDSVFMRMHVCMCVFHVWRNAKVNRSLVSVLNTFLDLTGHVQAYRHANEVRIYVRKCLHLLEGDGELLHKFCCSVSMGPWTCAE